MPIDHETISERLRNTNIRLTRAEQQLASSILDNYPISGLGSITVVAKNADVSTPTVVRMVRKLGFDGFPQFQAELRREVEASLTNPISKHEKWADKAPDEHILNRFTEAVIENIEQSLRQIDHTAFDNACKLLSEPDRHVFVVGGRITSALADYFFMHLQMIRKGISNMEGRSNSWPHFILDMKRGDILIIFDIRRYENSTIKLAELAKERDLKVILFTDQWRSPVSKFADICFSNRISAPSAWDSSVTIMLLMEAMVAEIQKQIWNKTRDRVEELEELFDRTRFFRKF